MKKQSFYLLMSAIIFTSVQCGCKKTPNLSTKLPNSIKTFSFSGSEYTGIANAGNHYYPRPTSIRFNNDSTLTIFSYIILNYNYKVVSGKITKVVVDNQGQTQITVSYDLPKEQQFNSPQVYTISADRQTISGGASPLYAIVNMKLFATKTPSVTGEWGAQSGYYPDINGIAFGADSTTTYLFNGSVLTYGGDPTKVIHIAYKQDGGRLVFSGVNTAANDLILEYYGVLSADGKTIYADCINFTSARLPSLYGGSEAYGPIGVTPAIHKN